MTFLERVCGALREAGVPYAVVGGHAVALHGAVRGTVDVDIALRWTRDAVIGTEAALRGLGLVSRLPVTAQDVFERRDEYVRQRNLIAWNFHDPEAPMDQVDLLIAYDLAHKQVESLELPSGAIDVLAKGDLIAMKKASGRPQDLADAAALEKLP